MRLLASVLFAIAFCEAARAVDPRAAALFAELPSNGAATEWRFLGNYDDESGNDRHLTPNSQIAMLDGYVSISGPTGFLTTADFDYPTNSFSVFAWARVTNVNNKAIVAHFNNAAGAYRSWYMGVCPSAWGTGNGYFSATLSADGGAVILKAYAATKYVITDGEWHHVGFTFSPNTLTLYVDGVESPVYKQRDFPMYGVFNCPYPISIGCFNTDSGGASGAGMDGDVGGVMLFPFAVNADVPWQLYLGGPPE